MNNKLKLEEYTLLLQYIAFKMLRNGSETIKLSQLSEYIKNSHSHNLSFLTHKSIEFIEDICSKIQISFFFKGVTDKAFSFIHKSIKDYLVTSGVFYHLLSTLKAFTPSNPRRIEKELYDILGSNPLSPEDHLPLLYEMLKQNAKTIEKLDKSMICIWDYILQKSFHNQGETVNDVTIKHNNVLTNYYYFLSGFFSISSTSKNFTLYNSDKANLFDISKHKEPLRMLFNSIQDRGLAVSNVFFDNQFIGAQPLPPHLEEDKKRIFIIHNETFSSCSFKNTDFINCTFAHLYFKDCSFIGTKFTNCRFTLTNFMSCDFEKCEFMHCKDLKPSLSAKLEYLSAARFINCNFNGATWNSIPIETKENCINITEEDLKGKIFEIVEPLFPR